MIENKNCFDLMAEMEDNSVDIIYTDPPYNLSTKWEIKPNGKPDAKGSAKDFMLKWEGLDGSKLELLFKEFNRILKHGGRAIVFGIDRQIFPFEYYACLAGLQQQQSLYWYFISAMPKATDLSKMLDKHFNEERVVVGKQKGAGTTGRNTQNNQTFVSRNQHGDGSHDVTIAVHELAKKYDGLKYSVAPLKQTNEVMLVFQKPYKTGSALHDVLAHEDGDETISVSIIDIENNRVPFQNSADKSETTDKNQHSDFGTLPMTGNTVYGDFSMVEQKNYQSDGRFPAQSFIDSQTAEILDRQSGDTKSAKSTKVHPEYGDNSKFGGGISTPDNQYDDIGGCSRILHKCDYDEGDYDIYHYCPKVGKAERNEGLTGEYKQYSSDGRTKSIENAFQRNDSAAMNHHPTPKPLSLLTKVLSLFKTPTKQVFFDPFAGSGSIPMACEILGLEWKACELNEEYCEIANARLDYAKKNRAVLYARYRPSKSESKETNINDFF